MPKVSLPPQGTSDANYFEKGHDEVISVISPDDLAVEIKSCARNRFRKECPEEKQ